VEFRILGSLEVRRDGGVVEIGAAKLRALLTLLLLRRGEPVTTETLIEHLWDGHPPATAVKVVHVYVSQLRKALAGGVLQTRPGGYALAVGPDAVDAARFEDLLARGRALLGDGEPEAAAAVLREALGLWRGPALADFPYAEFAREEAARLEELRSVALELRLEAELTLGRTGEVVPELERLVRDHPYRENLRRLLMLALYRAGRQADALAAYQDARRALADDLGLDPSRSLQQLQAAILRQIPGVPNRPAVLHFTPDGAYLFAVTNAGRAFRWDVRPSQWAQRACAVAGRFLTRAEWDEALPGRDYVRGCGAARRR